MIQTYTRLRVADNSGAKVIRLINIPGSSKRKYAHVGDVVVCNVREAAPNSPVRKGEIVRAVVIRQAQGRRRIEPRQEKAQVGGKTGGQARRRCRWRHERKADGQAQD